MTIRACIVGGGGIANHHARAASAVDEVELAAVCDISDAVAKRFASEYFIPNSYGDLETMLASEPAFDLATICTWGNSHAEIAIELARSGKVKAILCEKPICLNAVECSEMVDVARSEGVILTEAFKFRHHPMHLRAKRLIMDGAIGELRSVRSTFMTGVDRRVARPQMNWRFDPDRGGGATNDLGCYCIHHARFMFEMEPTSVFAVGDFHEVCGVDFQVAATLGFPGGASAQLSYGFGLGGGSQEAQMLGTAGRIVTDMAWNNEGRPTGIDGRFGGGEEAKFRFQPVNQFTLQLRHMVEVLERGTEHRISPLNSLAQMRVVDAVLESIRSGEVVHLDQEE